MLGIWFIVFWMLFPFYTKESNRTLIAAWNYQEKLIKTIAWITTPIREFSTFIPVLNNLLPVHELSMLHKFWNTIFLIFLKPERESYLYHLPGLYLSLVQSTTEPKVTSFSHFKSITLNLVRIRFSRSATRLVLKLGIFIYDWLNLRRNLK